MPSSAVALKAARTRQRKDALVASGMDEASAKRQAQRENAAGLLDQQGRLKRSANGPATPATPTPPANPTPPASTTPPAGSSAGSSVRSRLGGAAAPPTSGTTAASAASTASVASRLQRAAAVDPDPAAVAQMYEPTWEVKGGKLRVWSPKSGETIELPIEEKPGPYTPTEVIHDILGQPEMLYTAALAISKGMGFLFEGPTGTAKTACPRWFAQKLNWNIVTAPMHKDVEAADLIGEPQPSVSKKGDLLLKWVWGSLSKAAIASVEHPTLFIFEELNRVGNLQVFARLYPLLDDTRQLVIDNKEGEDGLSEVLRPGKLVFGATQNPAEAEETLAGHADYIGVQELDAALQRRFPFKRIVGYPEEAIEAEALRRRVKGLKLADATRMVKTANAVRGNEELRYPMSFPDLVAWATALPYYGWEEAAEISCVVKAHPGDRPSLRDLVLLRPTATGATP